MSYDDTYYGMYYNDDYSQYSCPPEFTDCGTFCDYNSDCYGDNYCGDGSWSLCGDDYVNGTCALRKRSNKKPCRHWLRATQRPRSSLPTARTEY